MANPIVRDINGGVVFSVKVVPGSSRTCVSGLLGETVKIRVSAPPQKDKANQHLLEFLAKQLCVKKNAVSIIAGTTNPVKRVQVLGISAETLLEKLNPKERSLR